MKKSLYLIGIVIVSFFSSCTKDGLWGQLPSDDPNVFTAGAKKNDGVGYISTPPVILDASTGPVWGYNANARTYYVLPGKWMYNTLGGHTSDAITVYINKIGIDGRLYRNIAVTAAHGSQVFDEGAWIASLFVPNTTRLAIQFPLRVSVNQYVDQYGQDRYTWR